MNINDAMRLNEFIIGAPFINILIFKYGRKKSFLQLDRSRIKLNFYR
jgi:hypothetical protein